MSWHQKYLETLAEGIKYLWNTGHFADATILVGNKRFRCHRAVLAAMSPHFDATFSTGMRDNPDGVLTLLNMVRWRITSCSFCSSIPVLASYFPLCVPHHALQTKVVQYVVQFRGAERQT